MRVARNGREMTVNAWARLVRSDVDSLTTVTRLLGRSSRVGDTTGQHPTRALSRWLDALQGRRAPIVVDLGPAVGANVAFLGEKLACKLYVEDVLSDLETWGPLHISPEPTTGLGCDAVRLRARREEARRAQALARKLPRDTDSVDAVLGWDVIDHLDADGGPALAREVARILKPGGVAYVCHAADGKQVPPAKLYEIVDDMTLRHRVGPAEWPARRIWASRAMTQMFEPLTICDSFLLTSRTRELVLRKDFPRTEA